MFDKILVVLIVWCVMQTEIHANDPTNKVDSPKNPSRLVKATSVVLDRVKDAAKEGAEVVENRADQIQVRVEKLVDPPAHQAGESNMVVSAIRGLGRLAGNATVEAGRLIGSTVGAGKKFVQRTSVAVKDTIKQTGKRLLYSRKRLNPSEPVVDNDEPTDGYKPPVNELGGQAPDELHRVDPSV